MLVGFRAGSPFPSDKSLVDVGFITKAAVSGRHAFWEYDRPFCFGFPDDLGLRGSSLLRALVGAGRGAGLNRFCTGFGGVVEGA